MVQVMREKEARWKCEEREEGRVVKRREEEEDSYITRARDRHETKVLRCEGAMAPSFS